MKDKIIDSYKFSKNFYDDALTQGKWWSKLYFKLLWGGVDDKMIANTVLGWIPDNFSGKLLDVPAGTAVFTAEKYSQMTAADITCLDYSSDMLEVAEQRFRELGLSSIKIMKGDVAALPFKVENYLHVFTSPDSRNWLTGWLAPL